MAEKAKKSNLLALFNTLEEDDKDIITVMAESLTEKCKNTTNKAGNIARKQSTAFVDKKTVGGL